MSVTTDSPLCQRTNDLFFSSMQWIQGYTYNHIILTLLHPDIFSQMKEKEASLQLFQDQQTQASTVYNTPSDN